MYFKVAMPWRIVLRGYNTWALIYSDFTRVTFFSAIPPFTSSQSLRSLPLWSGLFSSPLFLFPCFGHFGSWYCCLENISTWSRFKSPRSWTIALGVSSLTYPTSCPAHPLPCRMLSTKDWFSTILQLSFCVSCHSELLCVSFRRKSTYIQNKVTCKTKSFISSELRGLTIMECLHPKEKRRHGLDDIKWGIGQNSHNLSL